MSGKNEDAAGRQWLAPVMTVGAVAALLLMGGTMFGLGGGRFRKEYLEKILGRRATIRCVLEDRNVFDVNGVVVDVNDTALVIEDERDRGHIPLGLIVYVTERNVDPMPPRAVEPATPAATETATGGA